MGCILFVKLVRKTGGFLNTPRHAEPSIGFGGRSIVLSVHPKVGIVLTFYEPVVPLVAISSPWLNRKWLVLVILVPHLLVRLFDAGLHRLACRQRPEDKGLEEGDLWSLMLGFRRAGSRYHLRAQQVSYSQSFRRHEAGSCRSMLAATA